jgi:hypothetical protein
MMTVRIFFCFSFSVASGLLGCRTPVQTATDGASPPASDDVRSEAAAESPPPGPLDFEQVLTMIDDELGAFVNRAGSHALGFKAGAWREVVVFRVEGEDYCQAVTPEAERADCEFVPGTKGIPWSSEQYLGLAVVAYTDPSVPRIEHLRMLERGCQVWHSGTCAESPGAANVGFRGGSEMANIDVERLAVSDLDGDRDVEIELVTTYVALAAVVEGELGDDPDDYSEQIFTRRRVTVLRSDLSRQLDVDIHQVMFEWIPGVYADNDVVNESYELGPNGATVSWCEMDVSVAFRARECLDQVCASPTSRVRFPYDVDKDLYTEAAPEALRPIVDEDWTGCRDTTG